jgi:hypothetical protein
MTVPASVIVSGPYIPDGSNREWDFDFKVTEASQLVIILVDPEGVETEVTSGFTVPSVDLNSDAGGTLTYPVAPTDPLEFADYEQVYIIRRVELGQPNKIGNQGGFYPETHEDTMDLLAMQIQQLNERMDRAAVVPVSANAGVLEGLIADVVLLADIDTELEALAGISANITTVAGTSGNVTTVAGIAAAISTLSPISANITTVAGISGNVTTVAGIAAAISTLSPISANITTVAGISGNVTTVAGIAANITAVADNEDNINAAVADLPALSGKLSKAGDTLAGDLVPDADGTRDLGSDALRFAEVHTDVLDAQNMVGLVATFARNTAPTGWLKANGAAVSRTTYADLFAVIGTTFGVGDGSTTFNLPDMRGMFARGWDDGRGVDTGRVFGSQQSADAQVAYRRFNSGSNVTGSQLGVLNTVSLGHSSYDENGFVGAETRPINVALLVCIKY